MMTVVAVCCGFFRFNLSTALSHLAVGRTGANPISLGLVSLQTIERYLGCKKKLRNATMTVSIGGRLIASTGPASQNRTSGHSQTFASRMPADTRSKKIPLKRIGTQ